MLQSYESPHMWRNPLARRGRDLFETMGVSLPIQSGLASVKWLEGLRKAWYFIIWTYRVDLYTVTLRSRCLLSRIDLTNKPFSYKFLLEIRVLWPKQRRFACSTSSLLALEWQSMCGPNKYDLKGLRRESHMLSLEISRLCNGITCVQQLWIIVLTILRRFHFCVYGHFLEKLFSVHSLLYGNSRHLREPDQFSICSSPHPRQLIMLLFRFLIWT